MSLESYFPGLTATNWAKTSEPTKRYNCIAWAAAEDTRWWWPDQMGVGYWPTPRREESIEAFVEAFALLGYERCGSADAEPGFERVAIWADGNGKPTHMARQVAAGWWSSKLGNLADIRHELGALDGSSYGTVVCFLRRAISA